MALALDTNVQFVRGVGPVRAKEFATLGVHTVADLVEHFPFRHSLRPKSVPIGSLELGVVATVVGELDRVRTYGRFSKQSVSALLVDGTGECRVRWFNSPHLIDRLHLGQIVRLSGKVELHRDLASFTNPELTPMEEGDDPLEGDTDRHDPVYPGTARLPSKEIARIIASVLDEVGNLVVDYLPEWIRTLRGLPPRRTAIGRCHRPTSIEDMPIARRRLAYDELFLCQLAVQVSRRRLKQGTPAPALPITDEVDRRIRKRFPFELTAGQSAAVGEIREDLARSQPMNRLLQADVGAGKTAVAVYAALAAIANRCQAVLLAPTEVLADQHRVKVEQYLEGSRVRIGYLVGSTPRAVRASLLRASGDGEIDLLIGTHAILEQDVAFRELGLVIIDEQHKFGVAQRALLRSKGRAPHTLVLTATPIPRTLAMTAFGDLDVSTIEGTLPNRQPVVTRLVPPDKNGEAWEFVRSRLDAGEQAYIVYPLVEESEALPLKAAGVEVERLARGELANYRVGLLHGRMSKAEKQEVMERFRAGTLHVLVATTVIEVGVDVPNATLMLIQHAERYGLSQLHQLRGRIGRGAKRSYCLLLSDADRGSGANAPARLQILCDTTDGFRIAEEDLRLRGPGEMLGTRQHGMPVFKVADLLADFDLLEQARDDSATILRTDAAMERPEHTQLKRAMIERYGRALRLVDS